MIISDDIPRHRRDSLSPQRFDFGHDEPWHTLTRCALRRRYRELRKQHRPYLARQLMLAFLLSVLGPPTLAAREAVPA